ncbi:MAG: putative porin [Desulfobia sp.]
MRNVIYLFFMFNLVVFFTFSISTAQAGETDILIQKLVEKKILSSEDAAEIVEEIKTEKTKKEERVKVMVEKGDDPELPQWLERIKFYGDLRLRHDTQWKSDDIGDSNRNRERFRLRFGLKVQTSEATEVGVGLASGSGFQNTTNQSFDGHGRGKDIFIDKAYGKWSPCPYFTIQGGKYENHLFTTPLVWDPDVNPEGLAESFTFGINKHLSLFANLGQWFIEEEKHTNDDPTLLAYQIGTDIMPSEYTHFQLGATYYDFLKLDRLEYDRNDLDDDATFIGYNHKTQQMVFDDSGRLRNEFGCLEFQAKAKFKEFLPLPFSVFGSYIVNLDADIDDLIDRGSDYAGSNPGGLLTYGGDDRDKGWLIGFDLGNKKKKGDWYLQYWYQELEDYAFPAVFVDSDFHGGGTNNRGHKLHARYFFTDHIYAQTTGYLTEREDESKDGKKDEDRIQMDIIFKF